MIIETPGVADVEEVAALFKETWLATYPNAEHGITVEDIAARFTEDETEAWKEKSRKNFLELATDKTFYFKVARVEGKIVGVCGGKKEEESTHLKSIYVLPVYQGQGIGGAMLADFIAWAGVECDLTVHVAIYNAQAIAFYERNGFADTGKRFSEERFRMKSGNLIPEMEMVLKR